MLQYKQKKEEDPDAYHGHLAALPYLYQPLPDELPPNVNPELLLLHAAHTGNIDRYVRLRDSLQRRSFDEMACVTRGIYHNTMFAKWWSLQPDIHERHNTSVRRAINARYIMNNEISRITDETPEHDLPYLIWYPDWPCEETLIELVQRKPSMMQQIARTCIVANYGDAWNKINPTPHFWLYEEARDRRGGGSFFCKDIERRSREMGIDIREDPGSYEDWKRISLWSLHRKQVLHVPKGEFLRDLLSRESGPFEEWCYDECSFYMDPLEFYVAIPEQWREEGERHTSFDDLFKKSQRRTAAGSRS